MGFDDVPMAAWAGNALTTVQMRLAEMVDSAVEQLKRAIERDAGKPERIKIEADLVVRGSARVRKGFAAATRVEPA